MASTQTSAASALQKLLTQDEYQSLPSHLSSKLSQAFQEQADECACLLTLHESEKQKNGDLIAGLRKDIESTQSELNNTQQKLVALSEENKTLATKYNTAHEKLEHAETTRRTQEKSQSQEMDYKDLENYILMNMLENYEVEEEEKTNNIHLDNKFTLVDHSVPNPFHHLPKDHIFDDNQSQVFTVFCEQTIKTYADMSGVSLDNLASTDLMCIADDISSQVLKVINDCKIYLIMNKQKKLTCKTLGAILEHNYSFKCYGEEVFQLYEVEKNEGYSIQKQCEKQFDLLKNSQIKNRLLINSDFKLNCMDGDRISFNHVPLFISMDMKNSTYNSAQFYITQNWNTSK